MASKETKQALEELFKSIDAIVEEYKQNIKLDLENSEKNTVTSLQIGKRYKLMYSGEFCHIAQPTSRGNEVLDLEEVFRTRTFTYIFMLSSISGSRNIFMSERSEYVMFDTARVYNYVEKEIG